MKKIITFVDANKNKAVIEIAIKDGRFSMSGDIGGCLGQIYDEIEPDNEGQELLLDLWKKYHLNDMKAGTPKQMEYIQSKKEDIDLWNDMLSEFKSLRDIKDFSDYEFKKLLLEKVNLLEDILPNGEKYIYGTGWLTEELPEDIEDLVEECCTLIEEYETERKGDTLISDLDREEAFKIIHEVSDDDASEIYAICCMFDLTVNEIEDIAIEGHNRICVQGVDYLFGTDSEMDTAWDEALDNYLEECVYPELSGHLQNYFDDEAWKSDARMDGRGHSLNHYDGGELSYNVGEVYYYAYRQ